VHRYMVKKINNERVCEFVKALEEDELKAKKEYNEVIDLVRKKKPELVDKFEEILNDEIDHAKILSNIRKKINCK